MTDPPAGAVTVGSAGGLVRPLAQPGWLDVIHEPDRLAGYVEEASAVVAVQAPGK